MQLEMEDGTLLENPSERDLQKALVRLGSQGNTFAILSRNEMTYLQTAGDDTDGYILEYQVDTTNEHYQLDERVLSKEEVIQAFTSYLQGSYRWQEEYQWQKMILESSGCILSLLQTLAPVGWFIR